MKYLLHVELCIIKTFSIIFTTVKYVPQVFYVFIDYNNLVLIKKASSLYIKCMQVLTSIKIMCIIHTA